MPNRIFFFSSADILGGAERSLQGLVVALSERGHHCILITPAQAPLHDWARKMELDHEVYDPGTLRQGNLLTALQDIRRHRRFARKLVATYGSGVFYANTRHSFIMLAALSRRYARIAHHRDIVSRWINRVLYPRLDRNIFISEFNYNRSDAPGNGQVIYNAAVHECDLPPILPDPPPAQLQLAMFARITPYKGHKLALGACRRLADAGLHYHLDIWGEPGSTANDQALASNLRETIAAEGLTVSLRGFHSRPDTIMRDYHIILNPSRDEPFGRIPVEGLSLGVPVISHASGGSLEIYSGLRAYSEYLFEDYSDAHLADAIMRLLERSTAAQTMRTALSEIRTDICQRFSIDRLVREVETVITEVAARHQVPKLS